ncbi:MAG: hypothetical protein H7X80_10565 [bacterium]|nr:hypothetical protein [Candidatus Kapabacteria bacterium]
MNNIEVWDGDMDHGSWNGLSMDTDDDNTNSNTIPRWSGTTAVEEGIAVGTDVIRTLLGLLTTDLGTGAPMDDNLSASYRRSPAVVYDVIDPMGNAYRNSNPSGNLEWERFVIGTSSSSSTLDASAAYLPRGVYEVRISGMDMHNLNAWRYSEGILGVTESGAYAQMPYADCPTNAARSFGRGPGAHSTGEISATGEIYVWGDNCVGQLGDGTSTDRVDPVRVSKGEYPGTTYLGDACVGVAELASSHKRMLALMQDGAIYTWGENASAMLGVGVTGGNVTSPKRVLMGAYPGTTYIGDVWTNPIERVAAGETFSAALSNDGRVYAWGKNDRGQLGDNSTTDRTTPIRVLKGAYNGTTYLGDNPVNPIIDIVAGEKTCYALAADGTVYAWGLNDNNQIGDGTLTNRSTPTRVLKGAYPGTLYLGDAGTNPITKIAAMPNGCMALSTTGLVYTWGNNGNGQLGDNTTTDRSTPVRVLKGAYAGTTYLGDSATHKIVSIAAGGFHCIALSERGHVYTWGRNSEGALGDNTTTRRYTPVRVLKGLYTGTTYLGDGTDVITALGGGVQHSHALTGANGKSYSWGNGIEGRMGDGNTTTRHTPVIVNQGARLGKVAQDETIQTEALPSISSTINFEEFTVDLSANVIRLTLNAHVDADISVDLSSSTGDVVDSPIEHFAIHAGSHQFEIPLRSDLQSGMYFITVRSHDSGVTKKFAITR